MCGAALISLCQPAFADLNKYEAAAGIDHPLHSDIIGPAMNDQCEFNGLELQGECEKVED